MENNISRDHIALEAMKIIMEKSAKRKMPLKGKIVSLFGKPVVEKITMLNPILIAELSYRIADTMIAQRRKNTEEQQ